MASRDMLIAQVPVGYCHGFGRSLSNLGKVLIHGKVLSVVGNVTMNTISIDVTDLKEVNKGDEVVIIGRQKGMKSPLLPLESPPNRSIMSY